VFGVETGISPPIRSRTPAVEIFYTQSNASDISISPERSNFGSAGIDVALQSRPNATQQTTPYSITSIDRMIGARLPAFVLIACAALTFGSVGAWAQDWPNRPVKVIVPYGPGGITDVIARLFGDRLTKAYGQPFVIENRGGAGGAIGTEYAVRSPNDGYTIYFAGGAPITILPQMQKLSFDPTKDLTPVGMVTVNGMAFTVHPDLPVRSLREFIEYVRARPGQINYSVGGIGTLSHLAPTLLSAREGLSMVAVPYQSMPPTIAALLAGTVQMFFGNISDVIEPVRIGKARLLAMSTAERSPQFPDIPTVAETIPGFTMTGWHAYFAPAGTPRPIIEHLSKTLAVISRDPAIVKTLGSLGIDAINATGGEFAQTIQADIPLFRAALDAAGLLRTQTAR
jgi:tripartite-type tricarboxylate transporter receptor subunit TctC